MQPGSKQFLSDVFDVRDINIEIVTPYLAEGTPPRLNMQSLFTSPILRSTLVFRRFWTAILKTNPAFETVSRFAKSNAGTDNPDLTQNIVSFIQQTVPLFGIIASRMYPDGHLAKTLADAVSYMSDPMHVKRALVDKFAMRFGRTTPATEAQHAQNLLTTYETFWRDSIKVLAEITGPIGPDIKFDTVLDYYEYNDAVADAMNLNHRLGVDSYTGYQSDAFSVNVQGNAMMTVFEAASHASTLNGATMLTLMGSHCVYVHDHSGKRLNVIMTALDAINEREPTGKIVVIASDDVIRAVQNAVTGYCVHALHLIHPCMLLCLPKIAATFVAIDAPDDTWTLAPADKTIAMRTTHVAQQTHVAHVAQQQTPRTVTCIEGTFGVDLTKFCIRRKFAEAPQEMVYHDFIAEYSRLNHDRMVASKATRGAKNAIVIVDNRPNFLNIVAIKSSLMNLVADAWDVVVFCRKEDKAYYASRLGEEATYVTDADIPSSKRFDMVFYNELLKSPSFWARLMHYDRVLMVQDDGFIVKPGMEDEFLTYDYVGAPWKRDAPYNAYMAGWGLAPNYVGNGGLSLRNPTAMLEICSKNSVARKGIHYDGLQPEPEDVFFSKMCLKKGLNVPSYEQAQRFSSEEIIGDSYGFHKVFGYFSPEIAKAFFAKYISSCKADKRG
jgi:hypothetical protein